MTEHVLKIWPQYFDAVADGRKTFEVRYDDRGFQAGDTVRLREFDPDVRVLGLSDGSEHYSGRELTATIGYVLHAIPDAFANRLARQVKHGHSLEGYVAFSLLDVQEATK